MPDAVIKIFLLFACLTFLLAIPPISVIGPNMLACLVRWKESVNLHSSVSLSRTRNWAAILLIPTFLILCSVYRLYPSSGPFTILPDIVWTSAVFLCYLLLRRICASVFHGKKLSKKEFECGRCSARNFFIILVVVMAATALVCIPPSVPEDVVSDIMMWEIVATYAVCLIRKTQIFAYYGGFSVGFLYLCTLEILPTGLLIAPLLII